MPQGLKLDRCVPMLVPETLENYTPEFRVPVRNSGISGIPCSGLAALRKSELSAVKSLERWRL